MIVTGLWFLLLAALGLTSLYGAVRMLLTRHVVTSLVIVIVIFGLALGLEMVLVLVLRSHVASYKKFWNLAGQTSSNELVYVALGDSAAQGIGASNPNSSYVKLLAADMEARTGRRVRIVNLSVSGAKIQDLIRQQLPRLQGLQPAIVTVDIGANDIAHGTSQDDMIRDYQQVMAAVSTYPVVFANLPDFMWGTQQRNTTALNNTILQLSNQYGVKLADLHHVTHQRMWSLNEFAADGFHPSDNGHQTWASAFIPGVESLLAPSTAK